MSQNNEARIAPAEQGTEIAFFFLLKYNDFAAGHLRGLKLLLFVYLFI